MSDLISDNATVANHPRWLSVVAHIYYTIYLRWSPVPIVTISSYYLYSYATSGGGMSQYNAFVCIMWLFIALVNTYTYQSNIKMSILREAEAAYRLASTSVKELADTYAQLKELGENAQCDCLDIMDNGTSGESVH